MPRVKTGLAVVALICGLAQTAGAQTSSDNRDPTVRMFDNFFMSLVAARLCDNPDERTVQMFTRNLLIVQEVTITHFRTELPDLSRDEVLELINNRATALDQTLKSTIAEKGCADSEIINLVHMFDIHARMDLLNESDQSAP